MPVFINEVVFRGDVQRKQAQPETASGATSGTGGIGAADREALVAEVTQAVIDQLERELDRIGER